MKRFCAAASTSYGAHLDDMPSVDHQAAVGGIGEFAHFQRIGEIGDHRERHHFEQDVGTGVGRVLAQRGKCLSGPVHVVRRIEEIADFEVPGAEGFRGIQQLRFFLVRFHFFLAALGQEPVEQELELEVTDAVVVQYPFHVGEARALQRVIEVGMPDPHAGEADPRNRFDPLAESERAVIGADRAGRVDVTGQGPVRGQQLDFPCSRGLGGRRGRQFTP